MSKLFTYRFADGSEIETTDMTNSFMQELVEQHGKCIYNGFSDFMGVGRPSQVGIIGGANTRGDGFKTGYHPGLGIEIKSPKHFRDELKARGMVEVGNEKQVEKKKQAKVMTDEVIKQAVDMGADISGQEVAKLKGEIA